MQHPADRRSVHGERDDEALQALAARREGWFEQEIGLARLLGRIEDGRRAADAP